MFFSFQLALPKTSVLLLCQRNSDFLTFFILFFALCPFPLLLGHFALCPLEVYSFFYSMLYHSLSFWGSTRSFSMPVCFNSRFLTFFILLFPFAFCRLLFWHIALCSLEVYSFFLFYVVSFAVFLWQYSLFFNVCLFQQSFPYLFVYCLLPLCPFFPLLLGHFARCHLKFCPLFSYSRLYHSLSFWGGLRSFAMPVCFNSDFLTFFILFFALCSFPLLLGHFALCPFQFYKQPFALYFPLLLFSFFFVCGIHLLRYF